MAPSGLQSQTPHCATGAPGAYVVLVPVLRCLLPAQFPQSSNVCICKNTGSELSVLWQHMSKGRQIPAAHPECPLPAPAFAASHSRGGIYQECVIYRMGVIYEAAAILV